MLTCWLLLGVLVSFADGRTEVPTDLEDHGIYSDLDARVRLFGAPWLSAHSCAATSPGRAWRQAQGIVIGVSQPWEDLPGCPAWTDADGDTIADQLDILLGAKKAALAAAPYGSPYRRLSYPLGDVPRTEGVCTDVVIRALRNAGLDLQQLVHEDIARAPRAYPMVRRANANIDHRRVKTLLPYFRRHWLALSADPGRLQDWLPGDVVFMDTLAKPGPDHIGIVSDRLGPSGKPLIINSWTDGYVTAEMDLLPGVPVTHRFRLAPTSHK